MPLSNFESLFLPWDMIIYQPPCMIFACAGSVPSEHRDACEDCPVLQYSVSGSDSCLACDLPLALVDNEYVSGQHQAGLPYYAESEVGTQYVHCIGFTS